MALSKKALQHKREKKQKKRKIKLAKPILSTAIDAIDYSYWPIHECWVPKTLWNTGIGQVVISRKNNQGDIVVGMYLIDIFCLGIKDCFTRLTYLEKYQDLLERVIESCGELKSVEPSYANTLIHKVVDYANQLGFKPPHDFVEAKNLLKNLPIDESLEFVFGKEGKPYYMQGPHESPADVKRILRTLESNKGAENFHYLVEIPESNPWLEN